MQTLTFDRRDPAHQMPVPGGRRASDQQFDPKTAIQMLYALMVA